MLLQQQGYKIATGQVSKDEIRSVSNKYGKYKTCIQIL